MPPFVQRHLPLISPRIRFHPYYACPLPVISPRLRSEELLQGRVNRPIANENAEREAAAAGARDRGRNANGAQAGAAAGPSTGDDCSTSGGESKEQTEDASASAVDEDDTASNPYNKPPGEPNRPNSGGYSLEDKLIKDGKWTKQQYQGVMDRVHDMAKKELNVSLSYREQSDKKKTKICEQMAREYPILQHYPDMWPVRDFLKMYLKSTSASHRRRNGTTRDIKVP
ncbi:hypothetical protein EDD85DRAFT_796369 [Armillaria nabsnona]|nr:hypothetical protein EDD85DRAFT_796369 [Armillaria nabsnona]